MIDLKLFPWDYEENKPYWINPSNQLEWWLDKESTQVCRRPLNNLKPLEAVVFFICKRVEDKVEPIVRVILDKNNNILGEYTSLEGLYSKIDILRFAQDSFKK